MSATMTLSVRPCVKPNCLLDVPLRTASLLLIEASLMNRPRASCRAAFVIETRHAMLRSTRPSSLAGSASSDNPPPVWSTVIPTQGELTASPQRVHARDHFSRSRGMRYPWCGPQSARTRLQRVGDLHGHRNGDRAAVTFALESLCQLSLKAELGRSPGNPDDCEARDEHSSQTLLRGVWLLTSNHGLPWQVPGGLT